MLMPFFILFMIPASLLSNVVLLGYWKPNLDRRSLVVETDGRGP